MSTSDEFKLLKFADFSGNCKVSRDQKWALLRSENHEAISCRVIVSGTEYRITFLYNPDLALYSVMVTSDGDELFEIVVLRQAPPPFGGFYFIPINGKLPSDAMLKMEKDFSDRITLAIEQYQKALPTMRFSRVRTA